MRFILMLSLSIFCAVNAQAYDIKMFGKGEYGFSQPKYEKAKEEGGWRRALVIHAIADSDDFPFSSKRQGSIFNKIFVDFVEQVPVKIVLHYPKDYKSSTQDFEHGININFDLDEVNANFNIYYENRPYSKNQYIYPAIYDNNIHIITPVQNKLELTDKDSLKKYNGIRSVTDKISTFVAKDYANLNIKEAKDYPEAFELLLTGKADYLVGNYYTSMIAAYKLGIRDYITYSQNPVWKMPAFIRITPSLKKKPEMEVITKYFKSSRYKKIRDAAFKELLEIYKENTKGIVPPTYIKTITEQKEDKENFDNEKTVAEISDSADQQKLEN